jgi:hypothetical protein
MKPKVVLLVLLTFALWIPFTSFAGEASRTLTKNQMDLIERNILRNLNCNCPQVYVDIVNTLIDLKQRYPEQNFDFAILPLMAEMKCSDCVEKRIISALALSHFDSTIARYAIARRSLYDSSERVIKLCQAIERSWTSSS